MLVSNQKRLPLTNELLVILQIYRTTVRVRPTRRDAIAAPPRAASRAFGTAGPSTIRESRASCDSTWGRISSKVRL